MADDGITDTTPGARVYCLIKRANRIEIVGHDVTPVVAVTGNDKYFSTREWRPDRRGTHTAGKGGTGIGNQIFSPFA